MRKRQKFVLTAIILSVGYAVFRFGNFDFNYWVIASIVGLTAVLFGWALREGLSGMEGLVLLPMPALFALTFLLFSILVPYDWLSVMLPAFVPKIAGVVIGEAILWAFFAVCLYALLLTANIYSVAAIRTIALIRAAHVVGFLMAILTGFFGYYTILSFRLDGYWNGILTAALTFPLLVPALWSVNLEEKVTKKTWVFSGVLALLLGFFAFSISFWPINLSVAAVFLCTLLYIYLGVSQNHFQERLFRKTIWEYVTIGVVVLVTMLLTSGGGV